MKPYSLLPEEEVVEDELPEESDEDADPEDPEAAEDALPLSGEEEAAGLSPPLLDSPDFAAGFEPPLPA